MNENFKYSLERQYIEPAILPDGKQLEVCGVKYYVFSNNGEKLTQSRLYAFHDFLEEHNRFVARKEDLITAMQFISETINEAMLMVHSEPKECMDMLTQAKFRAQTTMQRLELGASIERIWEISAIWFIQEGEDPELNDPTRNAKKVIDFQTRPELIGFFQRWAKNVWNPLPRFLDGSFLDAIKEINLSEIMQNQIFKTDLSGVYSKIGSELKHSLNLQTETWNAVENSLDYLPTTTTN